MRLHRGVLFALLDFLFPADCFACGEPLGPRQRFGACLDCWTGFRLLRPPLCSGCGLPASEVTDLLGPASNRCAACRIRPRAADRVRAAVIYDDHARRFLLRAKLGARRELLHPLGEQLARTASGEGLHRGCTLCVGVPSHPWATLRRGFSPAHEMARPLARQLGLRLVSGALSLRARGRRAAKRLGRPSRQAAARGAFRARPRLDGSRVLLIDDVMTTGATIEACARELKRAGAAEVRVAVWARALPFDRAAVHGS